MHRLPRSTKTTYSADGLDPDPSGLSRNTSNVDTTNT